MSAKTLDTRQLLEAFGYAPATLAAALRVFPRKMWIYKDPATGQSIHDLVWQLADNEVTEYFSSRRFVADSCPLPVSTESSGAFANRAYFYQNIKEAMGIVRALRRATYRFLVTLPVTKWQVPVELPAHGILTLSQWLEVREKYVGEKLQKMNHVYVGWRVSQTPTWASIAQAPVSVNVHVEV